MFAVPSTEVMTIATPIIQSKHGMIIALLAFRSENSNVKLIKLTAQFIITY
jgi:hypothetical protein